MSGNYSGTLNNFIMIPGIYKMNILAFMAFIAFFGAGAGAAAFLAAFIAFIGGAAFLVAFIAFMASGMAKKGRKLTCELFEPKCLQTQCLWIESDSPKY